MGLRIDFGSGHRCLGNNLGFLAFFSYALDLFEQKIRFLLLFFLAELRRSFSIIQEMAVLIQNLCFLGSIIDFVSGRSNLGNDLGFAIVAGVFSYFLDLFEWKIIFPILFF